ncbi:DUF333 domain-containing protein [Rosenbergiella sp. S61]|uniref:DUF333 domain-containing protein n=1 Tax=Rosenbergiella gaditana TaxID=2726987 RepID=A0ABS5SUE0_9GAMM|nr:DUF333 domain-containing protein [Rosenbergiella gaditana]MBT0723063.1 DUF333 domain-containing protein [Rosenbergiella gaditana]
MKVFSLMLAGTVMFLAGCSSHQPAEPEQQATAAHIQPVHMSSLASDNCEMAGGSLAYTRQLDGSRVGMCQLVNGKRCSETALMSGHCAR